MKTNENLPVDQAQIEMSFEDDRNVTGSVDLIYLMPGSYEFKLLVFSEPIRLSTQMGKSLPDKIDIAPLETKLQVQNNNINTRLAYSNTGLSFFILAFTLVQVLLSMGKKSP